jgi:hypothetical protein
VGSNPFQSDSIFRDLMFPIFVAVVDSNLILTSSKSSQLDSIFPDLDTYRKYLRISRINFRQIFDLNFSIRLIHGSIFSAFQ